MRVVGGTAKGKTLSLVPGVGTRPILDRVKTALFDILRPRLEGIDVLDLFAGSGGVGIEALSQGAGACTFIELADKAVATVKKNLAVTGLADRARVRHADALAFLRGTDQAFDLIYVAPPQYRNLWAEAVRQIDARPALLRGPSSGPGGEREGGLVIAQIDPKEYESLDLNAIHETRQKRYGNTLLVFYELNGADVPPTAGGSGDTPLDGVERPSS